MTPMPKHPHVPVIECPGNPLGDARLEDFVQRLTSDVFSPAEALETCGLPILGGNAERHARSLMYRPDVSARIATVRAYRTRRRELWINIMTNEGAQTNGAS